MSECFIGMRESFIDLHTALSLVQCEDHAWKVVQMFLTHQGLGKARLFFIGNGGSAAIASHMATDWQKNGKFATFGPGDCSLMSCYGNDYGFDHVYSEQIDRHGMLGDVLFAISSSGMSENILRAVDIAKNKRMNVVTLSGFGEGNFLRKKGSINFYVPSNQYGTVEIAHLAILHSILDEAIERANESPSLLPQHIQPSHYPPFIPLVGHQSDTLSNGAGTGAGEA